MRLFKKPREIDIDLMIYNSPPARSYRYALNCGEYVPKQYELSNMRRALRNDYDNGFIVFSKEGVFLKDMRTYWSSFDDEFRNLTESSIYSCILNKSEIVTVNNYRSRFLWECKEEGRMPTMCEQIPFDAPVFPRYDLRKLLGIHRNNVPERFFINHRQLLGFDFDGGLPPFEEERKYDRNQW